MLFKDTRELPIVHTFIYYSTEHHMQAQQPTLLTYVSNVDDTTLWEHGPAASTTGRLQSSAEAVVGWSNNNTMKLNCAKTKEMVVCFSRRMPAVASICIGDAPVERVKHKQLLGVLVSADLTWQAHMDHVTARGSRRLYLSRILRRAGASPSDPVGTYRAIIRPTLEYACQAWHIGLTAQQSNLLKVIRRRTLAITYPGLSYGKALGALG